MTFSHLTATLKNLVIGWLLVLGLNEGLVECATACVKSEVILTFTDLYVENYARFLQESNLTLAETQVKFQEIGDIDFILLIVGLVLLVIIGIVLLAFSCGLFSQGIADYYILLFGQMAGILVMWRAHH